jgi:hypothetical protein
MFQFTPHFRVVCRQSVACITEHYRCTELRIGELLIAVDLINAKQLSSGLEYARAKGLPIGRVLKLLKILDDNRDRRAVRSGFEETRCGRSFAGGTRFGGSKRAR